MKHPFSLTLIAVAAVWLGASAVVRGDAPDWLLDIAKAPTPNVDPDSPAVVLLDTHELEVNASGVATEVTRVAIRILNSKGAKAAKASVEYTEKTDRCRYARAWIVRNKKTVSTVDQDDWVDLRNGSSLVLYDESRTKLAVLERDAAPGDVFGYETRVEIKLLVAQLRYIWGSNYPIVEETFQVTVPKGFALAPILHGSPEPAVATSQQGRTMTWTLRNQPNRPDEPDAVPFQRDAADLIVRIVPPANNHGFPAAVFESWQQVADWANSLEEPACNRDDALVKTAAEVTRGCSDPLSKIRALSRHVQKLRYVAVNRDLGKGAGWQPRPATDVLARGWGDCKDKANVLRALLREVGITSYPVSAYASEDRIVWDDCPTPDQFNHAILAIQVPADVDLPAVVRVNGKPYLFFDATDEFTMLGDLPEVLQGSRVHMIGPEAGALITLPQIPPDQGFSLTRRAELALTPEGRVHAKISVHGSGQAGARLRYALFSASTDLDRQKQETNLLDERLRGSRLSDPAQEDSVDTGRCGESFSFVNPRFLQRLPDALAIAHLDIFNRRAIPALPAKLRHFAVDLKSLSQDDEVVLELPAAFAPAEIPAPASLESEYGSFNSSVAVHDRTIVYRRHLELKRQAVPVSEYPKLQKFLSELAKLDKATVLLKTGAPST